MSLFTSFIVIVASVGVLSVVLPTIDSVAWTEGDPDTVRPSARFRVSAAGRAGLLDLPDDGPRYRMPVQGPEGILFEQGLAAYGRGDGAAAVRAFRLVVQQAPTGPLAAPARAFLAESLILEQPTGPRRLEAIAEYLSLQQQFPEDLNAARARWRVGDLYAELDMRAEALGTYQHALAELPPGADADRSLLGLAVNLLAWGKGPEAEQAFRRLKDQASDETIFGYAVLGLADSLHTMKRDEEAHVFYEAASRRWPEWLKQRPRSLLGFAETARALDLKDLARHLDTLLYNLYPRSAEAPMALIHIGDGFRRAASRDRAAMFYAEVVRRHPGSLGEAVARMRLAELGREWATAEPAHLLRRSVETMVRNGPSPILDRVERQRILRAVVASRPDESLASEALFHLGEEWETAGDWAQAALTYRELVARRGRVRDDPWPDAGRRRLAAIVEPRLVQALRAQDDLTTITLFHRYGVSDEIAGVETILEIAGTYRRLGFAAEAVNLYQTVLQNPSARPFLEQALIGLGSSYLDQEDFDAARQVFERYRLQYPAGRWKALALRALAVAYQGKGDHSTTIRLCRRWVQLYPDHPARASVWLTLALALEESEKTEEALQAYAEAERAGGFAERTGPAAATARLRYANLLIKAKRYDEAIRHFEALRRTTSDPDQSEWATFQMARARRAQTQYDEARAILAALGQSSADGLVGRVSRLMQATLPAKGRS